MIDLNPDPARTYLRVARVLGEARRDIPIQKALRERWWAMGAPPGVLLIAERLVLGLVTGCGSIMELDARIDRMYSAARGPHREAFLLRAAEKAMVLYWSK